MKIAFRLIALLLCAAMLFPIFGCQKNNPSATDPTVAPTEPPKPLESGSGLSLYNEASRRLLSQKSASLSTSYRQDRIISGETYPESYTGTIAYQNKGSGQMQAVVVENIQFGGYNATYTEFFQSGNAYCQINGATFRTPMTASDFLQRQLPTYLLESKLYKQLDAFQEAGGVRLIFSQPYALESWVKGCEHAQLTDATGTALLDNAGNLLSTRYQAEFVSGTTTYMLDVTVTVDHSGAAVTYPTAPGEAVSVEYFDGLRLMLRSAGDIFSARNISATSNEKIFCQLTSIYRNYQIQLNTYGSGDSFMANRNDTVSLTDYSGNTASNTQDRLFRNGVCTSAINGGEPTTNDTTAQQFRVDCENALLDALLPLIYLTNITFTDVGDFLCMSFEGSEAFADTRFRSIYATVLQTDLDLYADSHQDVTISGYLTINKHTGLPTAMGLSLERTHVILGVTYQLTYQLDQQLQLSSPDAYENITGEVRSEAAPAESPSPIFYKVTGAEGQTLWLLGTIHVGDARTAHLPQAILDAFAASDALAVEFDVNAFEAQLLTDPTLQQQLAAVYYYTGKDTASQIDPTLAKNAYALIMASGNNSKDAPYMKPAIWESLITGFFLKQSSSLSTDKGVDMRLLALAQQQEKEILEIESGLEQLKMLTGMSLELQCKLLSDTIRTGATQYCAETLALYELWCSGDESALTHALLDNDGSFTSDEQALWEEYTKAMFTKRNAAMLTAAKNYLAGETTVFYAVGLSHLLGDDGLVAGLTAAGYTVERVTYPE